MFSLFHELKFWTTRNDVQIRNTDFGAFKFSEKKENKADLYVLGKDTYAKERGYSMTLRNSRPERLKSRLKELETILTSQRVIYSEWRDGGCLRLITSSGLIVNLKTNIQTGALLAIRFDRFLVGKIAEVSDAACTPAHFLFTHAENILTVIYLSKPCTRFSAAEKLNKLEPRVQVVELVGPAGRRLHRHISASLNGDVLLTWWQTSRHEVYPWAPNVKDRDRANVHIYTITGTQLELIGYFRTESDPLSVRFSRTRSNIFWALEQKVSRKGDVTVENTCYHIVKKSMVKKSVTSTLLQTHVSCHAFSPDEERLVLGCIDGSLVLLDEGQSVTRQVRASFIPTLLMWHADGALILAANDRAQIQWFDLALSCVRSQLLSQDVTPSNLVDLGAYFTSQPTLLRMDCASKVSVQFCAEKFVPGDTFFLLIFEGGPIATLTLIGGGGLQGDVHSCGLTPDTLIRMYLSWHQVDKALKVLLSLDWNWEGAQCLAGLYHITNSIFQFPLTPEREIQLETALGCFHVPIKPLTNQTLDEFADQVHDLTRRFFHQLVRHELYEKAFCLALDLNDHDLFFDLVQCARRIGDREMAQAVRQQLTILTSPGSSCSCDNSSCDEALPPLPSVARPTLPDLNRFSKLRESAFFSRNPPVCAIIPEEPSGEPESSAQLLTPDMPIDCSLPGVIEKLYDLPAQSTSQTIDRPRIVSGSPLRTFSFEHSKSIRPPASAVAHSIPYIPPPPPLAFSNFKTPLIPSVHSSILGLQPYPTSSTLCSILGNTSATTFSSILGPGTNSAAPPVYPANPLSSHLYGAAQRADSKPGVHGKQKVKFSDTVTQIVVPDISQLGGTKPRRVKGVDPAQELADSLPLCLGNADYLKDFSKGREEEEELHGTIKVIHFGVV